jgi:hypothetical protein
MVRHLPGCRRCKRRFVKNLWLEEQFQGAIVTGCEHAVGIAEEKLPIRVFIQDDGRFTPEEEGFLILAFEYTLRKLGWVKRTDTAAVVIAKQIISIARNGERDPLKLSAKALAALGLRPVDKAQSPNAKW